MSCALYTHESRTSLLLLVLLLKRRRPSARVHYRKERERLFFSDNADDDDFTIDFDFFSIDTKSINFARVLSGGGKSSSERKSLVRVKVEVVHAFSVIDGVLNG